ncbi:hypothetical protein ILP97_06110 [Amycolatopsis sp. H6(2020)]|nr:hypothetical protein [Amycolatopsis sp. H6(2020)]
MGSQAGQTCETPLRRWISSKTHTQDSTLDPAVDRVADVFPDEGSIAAAGRHSQEEPDLLAVLGPTPVGIPANNIAHFKARQAGRRWSRWQAGVDAARGHGGRFPQQPAAEVSVPPWPRSALSPPPRRTRQSAPAGGAGTPSRARRRPRRCRTS